MHHEILKYRHELSMYKNKKGIKREGEPIKAKKK